MTQNSDNSTIIIPEKLPDVISTRDEWLLFHQKVCYNARLLSSKKNADYAHGDDPFANFHRFGLLGIFVRLSDKMARIFNWAQKGKFEVADETIEDTLIDAINYCVLALGYMRRKK